MSTHFGHLLCLFLCIGRYASFLHITKRRITTNLKKDNNPELPENQTIWKSDNQEVKEETFNQPGRKGRGGQRGSEGRGWKTRRFHIHMWINWEEQLGSKTEHTTQGSNPGK